jgi:hypothetical protein
MLMKTLWVYVEHPLTLCEYVCWMFAPISTMKLLNQSTNNWFLEVFLLALLNKMHIENFIPIRSNCISHKLVVHNCFMIVKFSLYHLAKETYSVMFT